MKDKDRFPPEHHQIYRDFILSSGNSWVFLLPLDTDDIFRDGMGYQLKRNDL